MAGSGGEPRIDRRLATKALIDGRAGALVVTGLGSPTYDVHAAGDDPANYYLWGAMGGAAMVGLGLAQAQPDRRVMVITGDGEQLMGLGSLATIATAAVTNLDIIVLDNEHYGETGMQQSHTAAGIELTAVAAACGFAQARLVTDPAEIEPLCAELVDEAAGPRFYTIKVAADDLPRSMPSRDAVFIKNRFRAHLGLRPN